MDKVNVYKITLANFPPQNYDKTTKLDP